LLQIIIIIFKKLGFVVIALNNNNNIFLKKKKNLKNPKILKNKNSILKNALKIILNYVSKENNKNKYLNKPTRLPLTRGVNPVRFPGFWSKPGTGTGVPRFFVLGNRNRNRDPGKTGVPVTNRFRLYPVR
jgi:hypothetical protein